MGLLRKIDSDDRVMTGAIMTSFPISLQFFERSVLPALQDKKLGDNIAVLIDSEHYQRTLRSNELESNRYAHYAPRKVGQSYRLVPVSINSGVFHPKIHFFAGERRVQCTVTSGNITHPGFTNNVEITTQVEVEPEGEETEGDRSAEEYQEKVKLCKDVREFLQTITESRFGQHVDEATELTVETTFSACDWLDDIEIESVSDVSTIFLHNLEQAILPQVRDIIIGRGEHLQEVDIVSPFLGESMNVPELFTDDEISTTLWLENGRSQVPIDSLEAWTEGDNAAAHTYQSNRYVHGKIILIQTNQASYCLSGSPNASQSALLSSPASGRGNIEAAILRRVPDTDYFGYLLEQSPFSAASPIDLNEFTPGILPSRSELDSDDDTDEEVSIELFSISYRRHESFDGGNLVAEAVVNQEIRNDITNQGLEIQVADSHKFDEVTTFHIPSRSVEWEHINADDQFHFSAKKEIYRNAVGKPLTKVSVARVVIADTVSSAVWIQSHKPSGGEPTVDAIRNAGADTVPRAMADLYGGDAKQRAHAVETLNGLLGALRDARPSNEKQNREREEEEGPTGGLRFRSWSQSQGRNPDDLLESFFEGWRNDISEFIASVTEGDYYFEEIETRLKAINVVALHVLVLSDARPEWNIPRQSAIAAIKEIYSKYLEKHPEPSLIASYCDLIHLDATSSEDNEEDPFERLRDEILPHIILGAIIAESHIAGDTDTYFKQQGWGFESLLCKCFPHQAPPPDVFSEEQVSAIVESINKSTEGFRQQIEGAKGIRRFTKQAYMDADALRLATIEVLGRSLLYGGSQPTEVVDQDIEEHLDRIFEKNRPYL